MTEGKTTQVLCRLFVFFLISAGCALAQVTIPGTPAGHTLQAWLDAFNSGDRAKIETYVKTIDPSQSVDDMLSFRSMTGGVDLLSIESSEPLHIRFRVKKKAAPPPPRSEISSSRMANQPQSQPSACAPYRQEPSSKT